MTDAMTTAENLREIADEVFPKDFTPPGGFTDTHVKLLGVANKLRAHASQLDAGGDEKIALYTAILRDKGDLVHVAERDAIARFIEAQAAENAHLKHLLEFAGVAELGARNANVASYCNEWEARAEALEAENARLRVVVEAAKALRSAGKILTGAEPSMGLFYRRCDELVEASDALAALTESKP